ncbi:hypothetical protein N7454_009204 [Penicillium verhagenii]|nr:hypothetical protein N7454_009204 [Penicillium verhagenii]
MSVTFQPFNVPGSRQVYGNAFPYGLRVQASDDEPTTRPIDDSVASLAELAESGHISELLRKHGAVIISGLGHASGESFAKLINAIERGRGSRPIRGGETPVAHSALVFEKVNELIPELVRDIHQKGLAMKMVFRAPGNEGKGNEFNWAGKYSFGQEFQPSDDRATQKSKAEIQVQKLTPDFRWDEEDTLELTQYIPGIRRAPASGRPVWFNGLAGRFGMTRDVGALDSPYVGRDGMSYLPCDYGDGTPIPREYLERLDQVLNDLEVNLALGEGDLLLVDNFQVSHGRKPWKGERKILVSMWEGAPPIEAY